jgi:arginyl-tRNA synthetase
MLKLSKFNEAMELSFAGMAPNKVCEYIYDLSNLFNKFYHENKIISAEDSEKKMSWISLITLTSDVLETCLDLLGIEVPDRM